MTPDFVPSDMRVGLMMGNLILHLIPAIFPVAEAVGDVGNAGGGWGAFSKACGKARFSAAFHRPAASIAWCSLANFVGVLYPRELCGRRSL